MARSSARFPNNSLSGGIPGMAERFPGETTKAGAGMNAGADVKSQPLLADADMSARAAPAGAWDGKGRAP